MPTILFAVGNDTLRGPYGRYLEHAGHCVVPVEQPPAIHGLTGFLHWDAALVDDSPLGRGTLEALAMHSAKRPVVGLGLTDKRLAGTIAMPLDAGALVPLIGSLCAEAQQPAPELRLRLDAARRLAASDGRQVALTRTEFRLLQLLLQRHPGDVQLVHVLATVWGFTEGSGTSELVRAHVRNLRRKLQEIGLPDAVRSRRGRGYALAL